MNTSTRRTGTDRVGGRSARVVQAVLTAALRELSRSGYDEFRVDSVASAAGVNKTSVYRRWPTKLSLVAAALRARDFVVQELPNYGRLRADLLVGLERVNDYFATYNYADLARMLRSSRPDAEREQLIETLREEFYARQAAIIERAIARSELPAGTDARFIVETLYTTLSGRVIRDEKRLDREALERLIELIVTGAEHGGARQ